jgi:hypothetical protein
LPDLVFLGFCAKRSLTAPFAGRAREIASVSECLSKRASGWVKQWDFNRATCWNTEAQAWSLVPDESKSEFRIFAYRALPLLFGKTGIATPVSLDELFPKEQPDLPPEPARCTYSRIGYDIVERNPAMGFLGFGCSPLSCNGMAENLPVNDFCLINDLETALAAAGRFGIEQPEPGPYLVIEVLTQTASPDQSTASS